MTKTILATIGLLVIVQKSYKLYCRYEDMRRENEFYRKHVDPRTPT